MTTTSTLEQVRAEFSRNGWDERYLDGLTMQMASGAVQAAQGGEAANGSNGNGNAANNGGQQQQGGQGQGSEPTGDEYSLAEGFLGRVPQEHRPIVEPYVKQWDAGVTRRFAELHSQLAPYQELGELEELQAAAGVAQMLQENPYQVYGILHQALINGELFDEMGNPIAPGSPFPGQQGGQQQLAQQQQTIPGQQEQGLNGQDIPAPVAQRLDQITQAVMALGNHLLGQQQSSQVQEEDAALDSWLEQMHTEYGEFDDRWVIGRVLDGEDPEAAITAFNDLITERASSQLNRQNGLPALLGAGGGGGAPADPSNVKNLSRKQTQGLVASVLASRSGNGS
jgi:hypothetical protein